MNSAMTQTVLQAAALIVPLIFAIVFHEVAHGYVAKLLGDPTASDAKRLSLNPLRHVDPVGTVLLPGFLALVKAPVFGWAKPVPVNKYQLRNPRVGMMLVAIAGPASNLVMAALSAIGLGLMWRLTGTAHTTPTPLLDFAALNLINFISINIFLALFNLLPIPPFDGSHVVEGLLPLRFAAAYAKIRGLGMLLPIVLLIVVPRLVPGFNVVRYIAPVIDWVTGGYFALTTMIVGG